MSKKTSTKMNEVESSEAKWTNKEIHKLLDGLLELDFPQHQWNMICKKIGPFLDRSIDSIQTKIRKLAIRYPDNANYKPSIGNDRIPRSGPFTWLDKYIVRTADNWIRNEAKYEPLPDDLYLSGVLGRNPEDLAAYREERRARGRKSLGIFK